MCVTLLGE